MADDKRVKLTHANGSTIEVKADKVETYARMGFTQGQEKSEKGLPRRTRKAESGEDQ